MSRVTCPSLAVQTRLSPKPEPALNSVKKTGRRVMSNRSVAQTRVRGTPDVVCGGEHTVQNIKRCTPEWKSKEFSHEFALDTTLSVAVVALTPNPYLLLSRCTLLEEVFIFIE